MQLVPKFRTPIFHPLCNQKFAQIKKQEVFLDLRKFLVAEGMKIWSNSVWHQLKPDKATFITEKCPLILSNTEIFSQN